MQTFVGIKLVEVLLNNAFADAVDGGQKDNPMGPILCVCFTNHALDQFLEGLIASGIKNALQSPVEIDIVDSKHVAPDYWNEWKRGLTKEAVVRRNKGLMEAMMKHAPVVAIARSSQEAATMQSARAMDTFGDRALEDLLEVADPWATSLRERLKLLRHWLEELKATANAAIEAEVAESRELMDIEDLQVLRKAQVVGMTTSGVAKMQRLITALGPRVIVVEEAAEVLEAHILTSLTPQTQHVILIGDHLQLRPKVEVYELSKDSQKGFDLDVSLFERLALSKQIPIYTLATQRRMRPEIANLIRSTIYPQLTDHPSVQSYPEVRGMATNLHFWDHDSPEKGGDYLNESKSKTNEGEMDLVVGLATYLLQQGYAGGEITILTPYVGQLLKLRQALSRVVNVKLGESDAEVVEEAEEKAAARGGGSRERDGRSKGDSSHGSWSQSKGPGPGESHLVPSTADLKDEVRLATVDNFQGEESTVIIISLVRNNGDGKIGFLKSPNRTNVLLSRAKHGMYIVGNASTMKADPKSVLWPKVLNILKSNDRIQKFIPLQCVNHPDTITHIENASDFKEKASEGGCSQMCGFRLVPCGHTCPRRVLALSPVVPPVIASLATNASVTGFMREAERLRAASMNPPTWKTYQAFIAALQRKHALLGGPTWSGGRGGASGAGAFSPAASLEEECRLLYCLVGAVDWAGKRKAHRLEARARLELVALYRAFVEGMMAERLLWSSIVDQYFVVTEREKDEVYRAMGFGAGHWYRCRNGHVYAIGECGGAMQESRCPECGEVVGGSGHQLREGNTFAADFFSGKLPDVHLLISSWLEKGEGKDRTVRDEAYEALAGAYAFVGMVALIQLIRIQRRVPEYGWTTQKVFHLLNFVVNALRAVVFLFREEVEVLSAGPNHVFAHVLLDLPGLLFFTTYTLLVLFWAEIYHQARGLPTDNLRPYFMAANVGVYVLQAAIWGVMWFDHKDMLTIDLIAKLFFTAVSLAAAAGFLLYGGRLFLMLRQFPIESRGRRKKLHEVGFVTLICFSCFIVRAAVIAYSAIVSTAWLDVVADPWVNVAYYACVELIPAALVLYILRKLPPKRNANTQALR
ncbi:unnamed protein product [Closterium sp. NIES-65]|nr:unnamed protein product [Closterium sp. NIES-65]